MATQFRYKSCLAGCVLIVALATVSAFASVMTAAGDWMIGAVAGNIEARHLPGSDAAENFEPVEVWRRDAAGFNLALPRMTQFSVGRHVTIPFWLPLATLTILTLILRRRVRPRAREGHCRACGYNLTENVSGKCSECGAVAAAANKEISGLFQFGRWQLKLAIRQNPTARPLFWSGRFASLDASSF